MPLLQFQEEAEGEAEETEGTEVRGGPGGVGASVGGPTREGGDQTRVGMTMEEEEVAALTGDCELHSLKAHAKL